MDPLSAVPVLDPHTSPTSPLACSSPAHLQNEWSQLAVLQLLVFPFSVSFLGLLFCLFLGLSYSRFAFFLLLCLLLLRMVLVSEMEERWFGLSYTCFLLSPDLRRSENHARIGFPALQFPVLELQCSKLPQIFDWTTSLQIRKQAVAGCKVWRARLGEQKDPMLFNISGMISGKRGVSAAVVAMKLTYQLVAWELTL